MGEGHFIKSVAIRWELVRTDDYLRNIPALAALGKEPLVFTSNVTFFCRRERLRQVNAA